MYPLFSRAATNLCFQEKSVYTQEVLAVVLQQLLEQTPIPMLFMRTVCYMCLCVVIRNPLQFEYTDVVQYM